MRLATFVIIVLVASTTQGTPTSRPTGPLAADTCLRSECHGNLTATEKVHGPVTSATCDACHELIDAKAHTYRPTRDGAKLCTYCHEFDLSAKPVIHKPVKLGQCLGCHNPHGGRTKALLREASVAAMCKSCHDDIAHGRTFLHTPVKEGACDSCHPPHAARFSKLLDVVGTDLCLTCHNGFESSLAQAKFVHDALKDGCSKCHDPHGSKHPMSTTQPTLDQCGGCHPKVTIAATNARFPHTPVTSDGACTGCHTPHGGSLARLMKDAPEQLCMSCHAKDVKTAQGRVVPAVAELAKTSSVKHGPIKEGSCTGCHASHGGDRQLLLSKNYSTRFYQRFDPAHYELCFGCHDARLVTENKTGKHTAFRNGDDNLHALHVRDTGDRGENCRDCHATHAAANHGLVRDIVQYGRWKMPTRFTRTPTGGSCFPGCHPRYGYDRNQRVKNTVGMATTLPTSMPVRRETPPLIVLDAVDVNGNRVKIPQGPLPVVVHVVNDESSLPDIRPRTDARNIVIVTGANAARHANAKHLLPTIIDADGSIAAELDVRGFPTTLVLQPDGIEIARLSGATEALPLKLAAYVDLAAGRVDAATVQKTIVTHDVITDGPAKSAAQTIRRIEFLIDSRQPEEALKLLATIAPGAVPDWRYNLWLARALIASDRFAEAKTPAQAAVKQNPASPEAHFTLGQVYEHEQNWPAAAAEYRAAGSQIGR